MKGPTSTELEPNLVEETTAVFAQHYNKSIPETFPRVSVRILEQFQTAYPALFKGKREWTVDKHRKKVMDWLATQAREA